MKTKEIKSHNLPETRVINESIEAKPYLLIVLFIVAGLFVLVFNDRTLGVSLMFFGFCTLFFMPKRTLIEFHDEYLVLYNKANHAECTMVYYEDVRSWNYSVGFSDDELYIELNDGSSLRIEAFSKFLFESLMNRYLKDRKKKYK